MHVCDHFIGDIPGLVGLFLATLFSGTLSTISSGMNSMSAVVWEDLLKPHFGHLNHTKTTLIAKSLVCAFGISATLLAFACEYFGGVINVCAFYSDNST